MNLCRACNEVFASLSAFDDHLVGKHAYLYSEAQPDGRRCLTSKELRSLGMRKDSRGRWRLPIRGTQPWTSDATGQNRRQPPPKSSGPDGARTRQKRYITRASSTSAPEAKGSRGPSRRGVASPRPQSPSLGEAPSA